MDELCFLLLWSFSLHLVTTAARSLAVPLFAAPLQSLHGRFTNTLTRRERLYALRL